VIHADAFNAFVGNTLDNTTLRAALRAGALYLKGVFSEYPDDSNAHRPQPFVSEKSRRYFFAALASGEIEVPYKRGSSPNSETFSKQWGIADAAGGDTLQIGNSASYGPLLVGREQAFYHKVTGWKDLITQYNEHRDEFGEQVLTAMAQATRRRG